ncbi:class II glutamine amidotransferase [Asticcacaulis sp. ZE23SCel15]|uniref:class II glutamine amidotransferase n=1 Tax=Asticcacaulis sp. ZE23SCel15 TaxID=3059027 RepID=UPI00266018F1|nr:class II glutamine amidotransferase [Asticcacaulis sp. ZE23SCel15]WKL57891.1 class II glutamine amidotransferase [Asticcacaulis sp. ZE23SCel15]
MCELLGMNANVPTDIRFSFAALAKRGGETGPHKDGWGISFYENKGCRSFHDPNPSAQSELAALVKNYPIKSRMVIAHVRKANRGRVALENTHPFTRELWGRAWTFAHNGQLKGVKDLPLSFFRPIGTTNSEHAFCFVMDYLVKTFPECPPPKVLDREISDLFAQVRAMGVFNALLTDGRSLYASCSKKLCYIKREAPFGTATLIDEDVRVDFAAETTPDDKVIVIATQPLTHDEAWTLVVPDSTLILRGGEVI